MMDDYKLTFSIIKHRAEDNDAVERLHARVFGPGRYARTAYRVREQAGGDVLAFTAWVSSLLVGAVFLTPIMVGEYKAFMLGPLAVDAAFEGKGIGGALLKKCEEAARKSAKKFILLVGDEAYYQKFGYKCVPYGRIVFPGPVDYKRVLMLEVEEGSMAAAKGEVVGVIG